VISIRDRLRAALAAMKQNGKRDVGLHVFMIIFCAIVLVFTILVVLLLQYLPDWAWYPIGGAWLVWLLFGDTLAAGYRAFRGGDQWMG